MQKQVPIERRKELATGVICSSLGYALETVSTGRVKDLEALQSMKVKTARWILGARKMGWSTSKNFKKLGWLTVQQEVTYKSVRMALKVLQVQQPRFLYERITTPRMFNKAGEWHEVRYMRKITMKELSKMKLSTRKSWAVRAARWMEQIPKHLLTTCVKKQSAKKELKDWCMTNIPTTGDKILRGKINADENLKNTEKGHGGDTECDEEKLEPRGHQQKFMNKWMRPQQHRAGKGGQDQNLYSQRGEGCEQGHCQGGGEGREAELESKQENVKRNTEAGCQIHGCRLETEKDLRAASNILNATLVMGVKEDKVRTKLATYLMMLLLLAMNVEVVSSKGKETVK